MYVCMYVCMHACMHELMLTRVSVRARCAALSLENSGRGKAGVSADWQGEIEDPPVGRGPLALLPIAGSLRAARIAQ